MSGIMAGRARVTVGLAVSRHSVRAVAVKRDRILWATAVERDDESLQAIIESVLAASSLPRWPRPVVVAAVGPSSAQTKRLAGLPTVRGRAEREAIVRESAARLFLRNGIPLVTAVSACTDSGTWGAAFDRDIVEAIERACRARRVRLEAVAPSVAVLGRALEGERLSWNDGDTVAEIELHHGELRAVRRITGPPSGGAEVRPLAPTELLASLGDDAWRFADALGAAAAPDDVLAWRPNGGESGPKRWRLAVASIAVLVAVTAWLVTPGVGASVAQRDARRRLTAVADVRRSIVMAERELARFTLALAEVAAFDSAAIPATLLLADLTRAMPEGAAIVSLRITGGTSTLVSMAPRAAAVLAALERVPGVEGSEMVGPVTREVVGAQTVERLSVRFRFNVSARRTKRAHS